MNFEDMLAVLEQWDSSSQLFVSLAPPFWVAFEVDRRVLREVLERESWDEREFRDLSARVGMVLLHILDRAEDRFLERGPEGDADAEGRDQRAVELEAVRARLHNKRLQNRYDLKKSSKAASFNGVDWDAKVKQYDANLDDFQPFPYATLRLSYQRDFEDSAFAVFGGRTFDSVQVNFSKDEVDHLIRVLSRVRERLEVLESERA